MTHHKVQTRRFRLLRKCNAAENKHQDDAPATAAISHRHRRTGALNNGGKMKICKKHQTFEVIK